MFHRYIIALLLLGSVATTARAQTAPDSAESAEPTPPTSAGGPASAPTPASIEAYVRQATKGGELDFDKMLASKKQTMFLHDGNMYTKREYALVLWGMRVKGLGVATAERACAVYSASSNRPLSTAEKRALTNGFDSATRE